MTPGSMTTIIRRQRLWLLPEKAIYWQKKKILLLADLHIGKSGHFRKHGIAVPHPVNSKNLDKLDYLIGKLKPKQIIILGDLFHSNENSEWQQFNLWRKKYPELECNLVLGNHDILPYSLYHSSYINLFKKLTIEPFTMIHDPAQIVNKSSDATYMLSGHIHPSVKLKGKGRQSMKLPCFYFGSTEGIIPAFGQFTGTYVIHPHRDEPNKIFVPVEGKVIRVHD